MVHWCRKVMNDETKRIVDELNTEKMDALEISGNYWGKAYHWKSFMSVEYPSFDLNYDVIANKRFDVIFAEQVLEHVKYPYRAVRNVHRMLNSGGMFLATTPFLIQFYAAPSDYTRWTEDGLKYLFEEAGFSVERISTGSWGNPDCVVADLSSCAHGSGWNNYDPEKHSLANNPLFPSVVWAVGVRD